MYTNLEGLGSPRRHPGKLEVMKDALALCKKKPGGSVD